MGVHIDITSLLSTSKETVSFAEAERAMQLEQQLGGFGRFTYDEDGFTLAFVTGGEKIKWASIERLVAYKPDPGGGSEICLDIFWDGRKLTLSEEVAGWALFLEKCKAALPGMFSLPITDSSLPSSFSDSQTSPTGPS